MCIRDRSDSVVVEVVRWRHLDAARTKCEANISVGDDRDLATAERQSDHFSQQVPVTLVLRMDHHCRIAEHCFRARRGDGQRGAAVSQGVTNMPQVPLLLFLHHFEVGDGGLQHRVPVDQALAAVDQPFPCLLYTSRCV